MLEFNVEVNLSFRRSKLASFSAEQGAPYALFEFVCPVLEQTETVTLTMRDGDLLSPKGFIEYIKKFIGDGKLEKAIRSKILENHIELYGRKKDRDNLEEIQKLWNETEQSTFHFNIKIDN